jgi:ABC-2 type transport system permease protein
MIATEPLPPAVLPDPVPRQQQTLRRLFLTLFLRGRGARGLNKQGVPKSVGEKLWLVLGLYGLLGCMALFFLSQSVFALAVYLHAMTFVFLGMFVASSAGEILFNKEEADILLHRPISPRALLWAKIRVLVEVSLWLAGAFNLVGLFVGIGPAGNWRFPLVHVLSTTLEALFCTGSVVLVYQLCLRWFGRERLEGLMTIAQVIVSIAAVLGGQILPQFVFRMNHVLNAGEISCWVYVLPPAWFAGFDDALAGTSMPSSWLLATLATTITAMVLWGAFGKLAQGYESGLQALNETISRQAKKQFHRRWLERLVYVPPLSWWLSDPVARASFLLTTAYLVRDRDVKLRVYPGIAPMLVIPFLFLFQDHHKGTDTPIFGVPFCGLYLGLVPLLGLQMLQYSQQWQASDVFRAAPISGPGQLCHGARRAVLCLLALPMLLLVGLIVVLLEGDMSQLVLLLPGIVALPVFALVPHIGGHCVPLSLPTDAAKGTGRGLTMMGVMIVTFGLAAIFSYSWTHGGFWWLLTGETVVAIVLYFVMRLSVVRTCWPSQE